MSGPADRRWVWGLAAAALVLLALVLWCSGRPDEGGVGGEDAAGRGAGEEGPLLADLYFPAVGGELVIERREVALHAASAAQAAELVRELLAGPEGEGALAPLPETVQLAGVHLRADGVAYLDLVEPEGGPPPSSGSLQEMLTVYSLVDTVVMNVPEVESVVLLWNGQQRESFAGHLDTSRPLRPELGLVTARDARPPTTEAGTETKDAETKDPGTQDAGTEGADTER